MTSVDRPVALSRRHAAGLGCLVLFLLPFAAVGLITGFQAVRAALAEDWGRAGFFSIFALAFGGVGLGGLIAVAVGRRKLAEASALEARHPSEPWLWRADWASGRIQDASRGTMWGAWAFAALWNLISFPSAFFAARAALFEEKPAAWLALLFPVIGVGLLVWAARSTIRYRRYGISLLELSTRPGVIGRWLTGTVQVPAPLRPAEGFQVSLSCMRLVTQGGGKNRSTSETVLWQEERLEPGQPSRLASGMGTIIPVAFALPPDVQPCDSSNSNDRVVWRLEVAGSVPGVDYRSRFEVPVFRTGESPAPGAVPAAAPLPVAAAYKQPPNSRIQVTSNRRGTEIVFPAARNPGFAAGLSLFVLLWAGVVLALLLFHAPLFFPILFGAFGLLPLYGALDLWFGVSRVSAGREAVKVASGWISPLRERIYPAADITGVKVRIGMQAGGRAYYDIKLTRNGRPEVAVGRGIRDKREAEWLAATLERAMKD